MKNLWLVFIIFVLLVLGCAHKPNEYLQDNQIPPDEKLIKISALELTSDYSYAKSRSRNLQNDADKKYLNQWLKITGKVEDIHYFEDGRDYEITLTGSGMMTVKCSGRLPENSPKPDLAEGNQAAIVGKLSSGGNFTTLGIKPCKLITE